MFALVGAAPAHARGAAEARAFADAAYLYTRDVWAAAPAARSALTGIKADQQHCGKIESQLDRKLGEDSEMTRESLRLLVLLGAAPWPAVYREVLPAHETFLYALDKVAVRDAALRSGRAVWRSTVNGMRLYASLPTDICARLEAWVAGGAKGRPLPEVDLRQLDDPAHFDREVNGPDSDVRRLQRAVARLRALGQGPRRSARFDGDAAFNAIEPLFREILSISRGL